jgi:hypothetical protein
MVRADTAGSFRNADLGADGNRAADLAAAQQHGGIVGNSIDAEELGCRLLRLSAV